MGPGLNRIFLGKSSQNSSKPVQTFLSSISYVFCLYTLIKVVSYCDLSVLSMSVMGFHTKKIGMGLWARGVTSIQGFFLEFV